MVSVRGRHTGRRVCYAERDARRPVGPPASGAPAPDPQSSGASSCLGPQVARAHVRSPSTLPSTLRPIPLSHRDRRWSHATLRTLWPNNGPLFSWISPACSPKRICVETKNTQFGGCTFSTEASQLYAWMGQADREALGEALEGRWSPEDSKRQQRRPKGGGENTRR